jgi:hypothetical protein
MKKPKSGQFAYVYGDYCEFECDILGYFDNDQQALEFHNKHYTISPSTFIARVVTQKSLVSLSLIETGNNQ